MSHLDLRLRQLIAEIERHGGQVFRDELQPDKPVIGVDLDGCGCTSTDTPTCGRQDTTSASQLLPENNRDVLYIHLTP